MKKFRAWGILTLLYALWLNKVWEFSCSSLREKEDKWLKGPGVRQSACGRVCGRSRDLAVGWSLVWYKGWRETGLGGTGTSWEEERHKEDISGQKSCLLETESKYYWCWASLVAQMVKNPPANAGDARQVGSIPGSGRSPGEGNGNPLQYFRLGNLMDRGAWPATVHGVAKRQTWQSMHGCREGTHHPRQTSLALVEVKHVQQWTDIKDQLKWLPSCQFIPTNIQVD